MKHEREDFRYVHEYTIKIKGQPDQIFPGIFAIERSEIVNSIQSNESDRNEIDKQKEGVLKSTKELFDCFKNVIK